MAQAYVSGYQSGFWASYRQWQKVGAQVTKGAAGSTIVFFKKIEGEVQESGIIFVAPTQWSTTIMPQYLQTSIEPLLDSFAESFAAENYKFGTIKSYRSILRKVGHEMDVEGVAPSALTLDIAERLGRRVAREKPGTVWPYKWRAGLRSICWIPA